MDDDYQTYLNRLARMTQPEAYRSQVRQIQPSNKFERNPDGIGRAIPFPGYTAITPPWEDELDNTHFYEHLKDCQEQLLQHFELGLIAALPPESFHLTVADLICERAYRLAIAERPEYETQLHETIARIFQASQRQDSDEMPICWRLQGPIVMPSAFGVCLVPADRQAYDRVVQLRQELYQNPDLRALEIEQQYHFTAHITLGYFGEISSNVERDRLVEFCTQLARQWQDNPPEFQARRVELRKFDDMMRYYRQPDWPVLEFSKGARIGSIT